MKIQDGPAPNFSDARTNLARIYMDEHHFKEALKELRMVEGDLTYPSQEKTYSLLGEIHFQLGEYRKAEEYLSRSLELRRQSCTTTNYYGRTLQELKRLEQSAEVLDQAIEFCRANHFEDPLFYSAMSYYSLHKKAGL